MPTRDEICNLCDDYMAAVSAHDLDRLMRVFAPDHRGRRVSGSRIAGVSDREANPYDAPVAQGALR